MGDTGGAGSGPGGGSGTGPGRIWTLRWIFTKTTAPAQPGPPPVPKAAPHSHPFGTECHTRCRRWGQPSQSADWFPKTAGPSPLESDPVRPLVEVTGACCAEDGRVWWLS